MQGYVDEISTHEALPVAAAQARAPAVQSGDNIALVGHPLVDEVGAGGGGHIGYLRAAVDRENDGGFPGRIKIARAKERGVARTLAPPWGPARPPAPLSAIPRAS